MENIPKPNGKTLPVIPLPLEEEVYDMAVRKEDEDRTGLIIEHLQVLNLRQAERDKAAIQQAEQQTAILMRVVEKLEGNKDKTALPNWLMPLICTGFIGLVIYVFNTSIQNVQRENEKLDRRLEIQETFTKNTREQLIAHGWSVDDKGNITAPSSKK